MMLMASMPFKTHLMSFKLIIIFPFPKQNLYICPLTTLTFSYNAFFIINHLTHQQHTPNDVFEYNVLDIDDQYDYIGPKMCLKEFP
jgi:hypothetical protein